MADNNTNTKEYVVKLTADVGDFQKNMKQADDTMEKVEQDSKKVSQNIVSTFSRIQGGIKNALNGVGDVVKNVGTQAGAQFSTNFTNAIGGIKNQFENMTNAASGAWHKFTAPSGEFSEKADEIRKKIARIKDEMDSLATKKTPTKEFAELERNITKAGRAYQDALAEPKRSVEGAGIDASSPLYAQALKQAQIAYQDEIDKSKRKLDELIAKREELVKSGSAYDTETDTKKTETLKGQLQEYETELSKVVLSGQSMAGKLGSAIGSAIITGAKVGVTVFGKTMQAGFSNLASGVKSVISHFNTLKRESNAVNSIVKKLHNTFTSFAHLLKTRIRRTLISYLFNDMKTNFGQMAKLSDEFNSSVSSMVNSCKALGAQILAITEPLINVFAPAITKVLDLLTAGADKLAQFTARVTGHDEYTKATKGQYNYAKALDEAANKSTKANKASKEYKNTVLGFDQLNKLNSDKTEDITGISNAQLEKAQTQATAVNEIADKIWDALTKHDFKAAGQAVGEAVNAGFSWLRDVAGWDKNAETITSFLSGVIDSVNGFIDGINPETIGTAIGDVFNTLIESVKQLTDPENGINFGELGLNVGGTIVSAFKKINWYDAGVSIIQSLQAAVKYVKGIISAPGFFKEIGLAIAKAFAGIVDEFSPEEWSDLIVTFIHGIGTMLSNMFGDQDKFAEAGTKIAETINLTFEKLEPEKLTDGLNAFFQSIVTFSSSLMGRLDWEIILPKIQKVLEGLDWSTMFEAVAILASLNLPGIIAKCFQNPIVTGVTIIGGLVISKLIENWDSIKEWFSGVMEKVKTGCELIKDIALAPLQLLWDYSCFVVIKIGEAIDSVVDWVVTAWNNAVEWCTTAWENIKTWVTDAGTWLLDALKAIPNGVISGVEWMVNKVVDGFNWMISQLNKLSIDMPEWLGGGHIGFQIDLLEPVSIPRLAGGGIVGDGQLFIANEGGKAEMIGDVGGQTAVVNNEQIVEAVASGVRSAVMDVAMAMSNNGDEGSTGDIVLYVDSEELARASLRGQRRIDKRTSPTVSFA